MPILLTAAAPASISFVDVFTGGKDGYACYRIPALLVLANGTLLAFAEGRLYNCGDHGHVDLVMKASADSGATWGTLQLIHSESSPAANVTIGNPAPVQTAAGALLLPFSRNNTAWGLLSSADGGSTWGAPTYQPLPGDWTWIATGPPGSLALASGRLLIPIDFVVRGGTSGFAASTLYSDDGGATWVLSAPGMPGGDECQAAALPWLNESTVLLSSRAAAGPARLAALSVDGGASWGASWPTLPETQCEASTVALPAHPAGPRLAMSSAFDASRRANLTLHTSVDDGRSWAAAVRVYAGAAAYSSLAVLRAPAGTVGLLFERDNYAALTFAVVPVP